MAVNPTLEALTEEAIAELRSFFRERSEKAEDISRARVAATVLSAFTRHEQTQSAQVATTFMMARELADNSEQLAEYLRVAMPSAPVVKALPKKT